MWFLRNWGRGVFSWCCLPSVCYICSNHLWLTDAIVTWTAQGRLISSGCPALGCSPWVGLLLRWSHSCLFVECPCFVPHQSSCPSVPFLCPSLTLPLVFLFFVLNFTSPQGIWASLYLRKSDAFCDFFSWFFSLLSCCAGMHDGKWGGGGWGNSFLPQFYSYLFCGPIPAGV